MEKKLESQVKLIDLLYEDLETKEQEIEQLRKVNEHSSKSLRKVEHEKSDLNHMLDEKEKEIYYLKKNKENNICKNGCEKYNRSMDDVVKYATKNKNDLLAIKEIAEEQKVKISCLRKHRNELQDKIEEIDAKYESEIREKSAEVLNLQDENSFLKKQVHDQKDEL